MLGLYLKTSYNAKRWTAALWHKRAAKVRISVHIRAADTRCPSTYAKVSRDYVSGQRGSGSACANVRVDLGLRVRKLEKGPFRALRIICCS